MRVTVRLAVIVVLLVSAVALGAQTPRGRADGEALLIRGLVIGAESGAPLRRARVGTSRDSVPAAFTGEDGRFELLAPRSSLRISKAGHVPVTVDRSDLPLDGSLLTVRLVPGAVMTGTVFEATGVPAVGARVRLRQLSAEDGRRGAQYQAETDDRGAFRIGNLPAGRYDIDTGAASARGGRGRGGGSGGPAAGAVVAELQAGRETAVSLVLEPAAPRATGPTPAAATPRDSGIIRGRVLTPEGTPVERASVTATPVPAQTGAARTATTDASGAYELSALRPGEYRVRVTRAGFPPVEYGQSMALQDGRIVRVLANGRVQGIDVTLPHGAAVSGAIVDAWGEPLEDVEVQVLQVRHVDGLIRLVPASAVRARRTDDRGYFRLHGLLPGAYYVMASVRGSRPEPVPTPAAELEPGLGRRLEALLGGNRSPGTVDVFYPGTPRVTDAISLTVAPGQDLSGLDMVFAPQPGGTVSGTAIGSGGEPLRGRAVLAVSARYGAPLLPVRTAGLDAQGAFEFRDVPPGDYVVQVSGVGSDAVAAARTAMQQAVGGRGGGRTGGRGGRGGRGAVTDGVVQQLLGRREFGAQPVTVGTVPVSDVIVQGSTGSTVSGRIELDGNAAAVTMTSFGLAARYSDPDLAPLTGEAAPRASAAADGTFTLSGLTGPARFVASQAPAGWWLRSVEVSGVDASLYPAIFGRPEQSAPAVVATFADGAGRIDGHVADERQQRVSEFAVIVFSTDQDRWFPGSPYVTLAAASQDGSFSVPRLPPGEYYAAAVERVDGGASGGAWRRPEMLGGLSSFAQRIQVRRAQSITAELKLVRLTM